MDDKVIVSNRGALKAKYGTGGFAKVVAAIRSLIAADRQRGITHHDLQDLLFNRLGLFPGGFNGLFRGVFDLLIVPLCLEGLDLVDRNRQLTDNRHKART